MHGITLQNVCSCENVKCRATTKSDLSSATQLHTESVKFRPTVSDVQKLSSLGKVIDVTEVGKYLCFLELRHPHCVCNIMCRKGSQTQQCILTYISVELHVSAYMEATIRFNIAS